MPDEIQFETRIVILVQKKHPTGRIEQSHRVIDIDAYRKFSHGLDVRHLLTEIDGALAEIGVKV